MARLALAHRPAGGAAVMVRAKRPILTPPAGAGQRAPAPREPEVEENPGKKQEEKERHGLPLARRMRPGVRGR